MADGARPPFGTILPLLVLGAVVLGGCEGTGLGFFGGHNKPDVDAISPTSGPSSGGTTVTVFGDRFEKGADVFFGGAKATGVNVKKESRLTCVTPAGSGTVDVKVENPGSKSDTLTAGFTYISAPDVVSVSPNNGPPAGGTAITLSGSAFQSGATVTIGGAAATAVVFVSSTTLTATTPARSPSRADVVVTNPDGQSDTLTGGFRYVTLFSVDNTGGNLIQINPADASALLIGPTGSPINIQAMDFDSAGRLYAVNFTNNNLVQIDIANGTLTNIGSLGATYTDLRGIALNSVGTLFGVDATRDELVTINVSTAAVSLVGSLGASDVRGIAFHPTSGFLFGVNNATDQLVTISTVNGAMTVVGLLGFSEVNALAFNLGGILFGVDTSLSPARLITIETLTGAGTLVGDILGFSGLSGVAFGP